MASNLLKLYVEKSCCHEAKMHVRSLLCCFSFLGALNLGLAISFQENGITFTSFSGSIHQPSAANIDCTWTIAPTACSSVSILSTKFYIGPNTLSILSCSDKESSSPQLISTLRGFDLPNNIVVARFMHVCFTAGRAAASAANYRSFFKLPYSGDSSCLAGQATGPLVFSSSKQYFSILQQHAAEDWVHCQCWI